MTAPVSAKADDQQVRGLLQRLRDVKVQEFIAEDPAEVEPYGLHLPALRLALRIGQERAEQTLLLGKAHGERKGVYAKRGEASRVFLLPQEFWEHLPKTAAAVRDKTLLRFERDHVTRLELHAPDRHIVITKTAPRQ
jgi:hypothetical protein